MLCFQIPLQHILWISSLSTILAAKQISLRQSQKLCRSPSKNVPVEILDKSLLAFKGLDTSQTFYCFTDVRVQGAAAGRFESLNLSGSSNVIESQEYEQDQKGNRCYHWPVLYSGHHQQASQTVDSGKEELETNIWKFFINVAEVFGESAMKVDTKQLNNRRSMTTVLQYCQEIARQKF